MDPRILEPKPPKKLLALDGGGIRGLISIEILAEIERQLQTKLGRDDSFVLADYFDYIAGTSTGAIIGTCLALGMRVREIATFYEHSGPAMFDRASWLRRFNYKYEDARITQNLKDVFGADTSLGSEELRTLLLLVLRNATTDSPWLISNNPSAKYNAPERQDSNLRLPLWQLVRASTAVPVYFPPEVAQVGNISFVLQDGGMTMYNNPAFQLFLRATVEAYNLGWRAGEKEMLVVSIGTGSNPHANTNLAPGETNLLYNASSISSALMFAASNEQDFLCRVFGKCVVGEWVDREVGNMVGERGPVFPKLFTYLRPAIN